jgi:hypothetical protein
VGYVLWKFEREPNIHTSHCYPEYLITQPLVRGVLTQFAVFIL